MIQTNEVVNAVLGFLKKRAGQKITDDMLDELHEDLSEFLDNSVLDGEG